LPLVALAVSAFVANLRDFVMGAALQHYLTPLPRWQHPIVWYTTVDQNWAINIEEARHGKPDLGRSWTAAWDSDNLGRLDLDRLHRGERPAVGSRTRSQVRTRLRRHRRVRRRRSTAVPGQP
jgi:hypothetical protein